LPLGRERKGEVLEAERLHGVYPEELEGLAVTVTSNAKHLN
jgi:hypothetical protein